MENHWENWNRYMRHVMPVQNTICFVNISVILLWNPLCCALAMANIIVHRSPGVQGIGGVVNSGCEQVGDDLWCSVLGSTHESAGHSTPYYSSKPDALLLPCLAAPCACCLSLLPSKSNYHSHHPASSTIMPFADEYAVSTATGLFPLIFFANYIV